MFSLKNGETEKVARQHDATQTQEAAPLPPMQSAHIHGTSSSTGLITKADSGLARHEHSPSEWTQSLGMAYASTRASGTLAEATSEARTISQVKWNEQTERTEQAHNMQWSRYRSEAGA